MLKGLLILKLKFVLTTVIFLCLMLPVAISQNAVDTAVTIAPDSTIYVKVASITITGNRKTKAYIIQREISLKKGDSIRLQELPGMLLQARNLVYNTNLFTEVAFTSLILQQDSLNVHVSVKEKWYIYPTPQFQLVDRNFNEWIKVFNADLNRVIYGAKFVHYNFSGRRDVLRLSAVSGYARNLSFSYSNPYSNRALTEGYGVALSYTENREITYNTSADNKLQQYRNGNFVRTAFNLSGSYNVRKGYFKTHYYAAGITAIKITDSIISVKYNPDYFNANNTRQIFPDFAYGFAYINTNNINYPLTGKIYGMSFSKRGLGISGGINLLAVDGAYTRFLEHKKDWYSSIELAAKIKLPFKQAYINRRALGYGEFYLRGLEYYVIDGVAAALARYTLKKKLVAFKIPIPFKNRFLQNIPVTLFAKGFADFGYSYLPSEHQANLNNKMLYTTGFGVDVLTFYDLNIRVEYSFNQLGQNGLFLHVKGGF